MADSNDEAMYGGCEGPNSMYVKLISSDGYEFIIKREYAFVSRRIRSMLSGPEPYAENETNEVSLRDIRALVLERVCLYFAYNASYTNSSPDIPEFEIPPDTLVEFFIASNFLDC